MAELAVSQIIQIARVLTTLDGTEYFEGQQASGGTNSSFRASLDTILKFLTEPPPQRAFSASQSLTVDDLDYDLTNRTATGLVQLTAPPAVVGRAFSMSRQVLQRFQMKPYSGERFLNQGVNKFLDIISLGDVTGYCYYTGEWTVYGDSCLYLFER